MAVNSRKPSGTIPWPTTLLSGPHGVGKSWTALQGSSSTKVGRTFVITLGELLPEHLSAIPGADYEIVEHDGTYDSILGAVLDIAAEPRDGAPWLTILDTGTALWKLIVSNMQAIANKRARDAARAAKRPIPEGDARIDPDLWTLAREQWYAVLNPLRTMHGPSIITARMEETVVVKDGRPTTDKVWRTQAESNLPFDVAAVVELTGRGSYTLTKADSALIQLAGPKSVTDFTMDGLWDDMGLNAAHVGQASYALAKRTDRPDA